MWKEYRNLPLIEEHSEYCRQMNHYYQQRCVCDYRKRVDYSVELWNKIKDELDKLCEQ